MTLNENELQTYLNDHLSGATAGLDLARHLADENAASKLHGALTEVATEIEMERELLKEVLRSLGLQENPVKKALGWVGEKAALPKFQQGPGKAGVARLLGLEALCVGIYGKRSLWQALEAMQQTDSRLQQFDFHGLFEKAERQLGRLEMFRIKAAA